MAKEFFCKDTRECGMRYKKEGKFWGVNYFLIFYDIENKKEIKTFKFDDSLSAQFGTPWHLVNKNIFSYYTKKKLYLIDLKNHTIKNEYKIKFYSDIFFLNETKILMKSGCNIHQCELEKSNKIKIIGTKNLDNIYSYDFSEYPGNKLIFVRKPKDSYKRYIALYT